MEPIEKDKKGDLPDTHLIPSIDEKVSQEETKEKTTPTVPEPLDLPSDHNSTLSAQVKSLQDPESSIQKIDPNLVLADSAGLVEKKNEEIKSEEILNEDVKILTEEFPDLGITDCLETPSALPAMFREPSAGDPEAPDSQHSYFKELGSLRVQMSDWVDSSLNYVYDDSPISPEGLARVNKEIKALTRALPCEPSGAVFLHIDSSNLSRLKVVISGPEDTPYEHGLYLFDIKLDENYPITPPKMAIRTTGDGTLRFNPNLYDSGFVCLSIINTWGGDPEEMWNPSFSTLMQVFLSIQALVMNKDVIQKEPGYEHYLTDCAENIAYSTIVKVGNISHAMIDMIKNPPCEFKEVVLKHFALKKEKILETVEKWTKQLDGVGQGFGDSIVNSHNYSTVSLLTSFNPVQVFEKLLAELKEELNKLPSI